MSKKEPGEPQLAAWQALRRAHAVAVGAVEAKLGAAGEIPVLWYDVLSALQKCEGHCCLRFRKLQEEIALSRSALSRLIDALAKAGLVRKKSCPDDARGLIVELTDRGRKALASAWPVYRTALVEHFAQHLTIAEAETVAATLGKIATAD